MSHGGAQWCHRANTMDNLHTAVVKRLSMVWLMLWLAYRIWYWFLSCTIMLLVPHCRCWLGSGRLLFNSLSLAQYQLIFYLIVT